MSSVRTVTDATCARESGQREGLAMVQFEAAWRVPCRPALEDSLRRHAA